MPRDPGVPDEPEALREAGRCGAKCRPNAKFRFCHQMAMPNGRCKQHGGKNPPPGPSHHRYESGLYSKTLPRHLRADYEAQLLNPDLLTLRREIAVLDARLAELLGAADVGETRQLWESVERIAGEMLEALNRNDAAKLAALVGELVEAARNGANSWRAWGAVQAAMETRNRLVTSERKRQLEQGEMLERAAAIALFGALADAVRKHTKPDGPERGAILAEFDAITGGGTAAVGSAADRHGGG